MIRPPRWWRLRRRLAALVTPDVVFWLIVLAALVAIVAYVWVAWPNQ